MEILLLTG